MAPELIPCSRCGRMCQLASSATEEARLLKNATAPDTSGYCPDCAVTAFFKVESPLGMLMEHNAKGKAMLLDERVQAQFAVLLRVGKADAIPQEIDWQRVHDAWDLPCVERKPGKRRGKKSEKG